MIQIYCVSLQRNNYLFYFNSIRMKKEIIDQLYNAFEQFALEVNGVDCWSARELQELLGYKKGNNIAVDLQKS